MKFSLEKEEASQFLQFQKEQSIQRSRVTTIRKNQRNSTKKQCQKNYLRWTLQQNTLYLRFLKVYQRKFNSKSKSKKHKKFQKMAQFIDSKNSNQCRSHHQKLLLKYKSNDKIIEHLSLELKTKMKFIQKLDVEKIAKTSMEESGIMFVETQLKEEHIVQQMPASKILIDKKFSQSQTEQKQRDRGTDFDFQEQDIFNVLECE